ncbi:hypothetical protein U959_02666 [Staphylococcus aureus 88088-1]|nr:hypothetical protein U959_02666 [Staphylococcus aureus 88088-1]
MAILKNSQMLPILTILTILTIFMVIILALVLSYSYFNLVEINTLVDSATEQNLEYELLIHNNLTNSYSFNVIGH